MEIQSLSLYDVGLRPLNETELSNIDGGVSWFDILKFVNDNWDSIKKGAVDGWNAFKQ